ncbi:MAG: hypothetical protein Q8P81_03035, partial [Nanoarchaeota archaeon]|nr:hypothetical protein [Nanoarchaeota archaeon]
MEDENSLRKMKGNVKFPNKRETHLKGGKADTEFYVQVGILVVLALMIVYSGGKIYGTTGEVTTGIGLVSALEIIPVGTPFYGESLGFSYEDISATDPKKADQAIRKFAVRDQQINLVGADLERYID